MEEVYYLREKNKVRRFLRKISISAQTAKDLSRNIRNLVFYLFDDIVSLIELLLHGGVLIGEFTNGQVFDLAISQTKMIVGLEEVVPHLLKVGYRLIYGCNGILEAVVGVLNVRSELLLKLLQLVLKVGNIDFLALGDSQLASVLQALLGRLNEQGDDGDEELRILTHPHYKVRREGLLRL